MSNILYITQDGITDHIGQAQIAPYLIGLARLGHKIHIVSAEKPGRQALKQKYRAIFDSVGIKWSFVRYANRPPLVSSAVVLWRMHRCAEKVIRREGQRILHCRAYLPLESAVRLKRKYGMKLLLDFRDFWADVGLETKPFKFVFKALKRREPDYINAADEIVTLTERAADILRTWYPNAVGGNRARYHIIPCCADFDHFDPDRVDPAAVEAARARLDLSTEDTILLYLGSLGNDYLLPQMMALFRSLLDLRPRAKFLFLSNNGFDYVDRERAAAGVPPEAIRFTSADRSEVPAYLSLADLSVVFIRPTLSKAGCSPTKLAELFALNIPVVANAGVGDLDQIIALERNGSMIVDDFEPQTLSAALLQVLDRAERKPRSIRSGSLDMSLAEGVRRYARIYERLGSEVPKAEAEAERRLTEVPTATSQ